MTGMSANAPSVRRISQDSPWRCESYNSENDMMVHFNQVITSANQYVNGDNGLISTKGVNAKNILRTSISALEQSVVCVCKLGVKVCNWSKLHASPSSTLNHDDSLACTSLPPPQKIDIHTAYF